jgi:hypothetical protein
MNACLFEDFAPDAGENVFSGLHFTPEAIVFAVVLVVFASGPMDEEDLFAVFGEDIAECSEYWCVWHNPSFKKNVPAPALIKYLPLE